jgi:hypothetical protein
MYLDVLSDKVWIAFLIAWKPGKIVSILSKINTSLYMFKRGKSDQDQADHPRVPRRTNPGRAAVTINVSKAPESFIPSTFACSNMVRMG